MPNQSLYSNFFLKDFIVWVFFKCSLILLLMLGSPSPQSSVDSFLTDVISGTFGFIPVWFFGALASEFAIVSLTTIVAYIVVISSILSGQENSAKRALWAILTLSLFTLWIEPWITIGTTEGMTGMVIAHVFSKAFMIFDPLVTAIWFFGALAIMRKISSATRSSNTYQTPSASLMRQRSPILAIVLSFAGFGYFYLGQVGKGVLHLILIFLTWSQPVFFCPIYLLSIVDAHRLAKKYNAYNKIGKWSICWNPYTLGIACVIGFPLGAIFSS